MPLIKRYQLPLTMALILVLLQFLHQTIIPDLLIYQRGEIISGQWWRLLTGHFVHLGWTHLAFNLTGMLLIWLLAERLFTIQQWLLMVIGCAILSGLLLLQFVPNLSWYVGLSGVLHGIPVIIAFHQIITKQLLGWLILVAVVAKIGWEQWSGPSAALADQIGGNVIIDAHLYGAVAGAIITPLFLLLSWRHLKHGHQSDGS